MKELSAEYAVSIARHNPTYPSAKTCALNAASISDEAQNARKEKDELSGSRPARRATIDRGVFHTCCDAFELLSQNDDARYILSVGEVEKSAHALLEKTFLEAAEVSHPEAKLEAVLGTHIYRVLYTMALLAIQGKYSPKLRSIIGGVYFEDYKEDEHLIRADKEEPFKFQQLRLKKSFYDAFQKAAEEAGMRPTTFIRKAVFAAMANPDVLDEGADLDFEYRQTMKPSRWNPHT